jgi:hypothetical protein
MTPPPTETASMLSRKTIEENLVKYRRGIYKEFVASIEEEESLFDCPDTRELLIGCSQLLQERRRDYLCILRRADISLKKFRNGATWDSIKDVLHDMDCKIRDKNKLIASKFAAVN